MTEKAPATGPETELLLGYIAQQRYAMWLTAYGLTDEQARSTPTRSTLSVGGLIKHTIAMERQWIDTAVGREMKFQEAMAQYEVDFTFLPDDTLESLFAVQAEVGAETERVVRELSDLEHPVPVDHDAPWNDEEGDFWSLRWVLLHLVEEIARHAGHADLIREHIDGATTFPLLAAAEGWPANDFLQPWQPPTEPAR